MWFKTKASYAKFTYAKKRSKYWLNKVIDLASERMYFHSEGIFDMKISVKLSSVEGTWMISPKTTWSTTFFHSGKRNDLWRSPVFPLKLTYWIPLIPAQPRYLQPVYFTLSFTPKTQAFSSDLMWGHMIVL